MILLIPGMLAAEQEVALESEGGAAPLQWFVDGRLIDVAGPDGRAWWAPTLGQHELLVVDAAGRSAARSLEVRLGTGAGAPD